MKPKTAANYTSLVSSILSAASSKNVLARTLRGLSAANPSDQTRYDRVWDSDELLAFIQHKFPDNARLSELDLRLKASALIALSIFGRASDLYALRFHGLVWTGGGVLIQSAPIKHSPDGEGWAEPVLVLPCSIQAICPIAALRAYLDVTKPKRIKLDSSLGSRSWDHRLFLSTGSRICCILSSTIAGRLTNLLKDSGFIGYTAESFRHAGASRAIKDGAPSDRVARRGRWHSTPTMEKHYIFTKTLRPRQHRNDHPEADIFSYIESDDLRSFVFGSMNPRTGPVLLVP